MFLDQLRDACLALPGTTEDQPFGPDVVVWRIGGKMFALADLDGESVNLKCDPQRALELRERHPDDVRPGYHMNKRHWNTVRLRGSQLPDAQILELIRHSYDLVGAGPRKKPRKSDD